MSTNQVEARLLELLRGAKRGELPDPIRPEMDLVADLDLGSAEVMDLLAGVEDEFGIEISEVDAARLRTVGDVVAYVEKKSQGAA